MPRVQYLQQEPALRNRGEAVVDTGDVVLDFGVAVHHSAVQKVGVRRRVDRAVSTVRTSSVRNIRKQYRKNEFCTKCQYSKNEFSKKNVCPE